jgi:hypothetical protein
MDVGFRLGAPAAAVRVGLFLDVSCARSQPVFDVLVGQVLPFFRARRPGRLSLSIWPLVRPWCAHSLAPNEAALAVRRTRPESYLDFCGRVLGMARRGDGCLGGSAAYRTTPGAAHEALAAVAERCGADRAEVLRQLRPGRAGEGSAVSATVKLCAFFAVQNGVRASPTVTVNGLVDYSPEMTWGLAEWADHLERLL